MPCMDGGPSPREVARTAQREVKWFEALVCGIFTHMNGTISDLLDNLDYEEMGITRRDVEAWWAEHKRKDEERRRMEEAQRVVAERRASAMAKLTEEEKQALGISDRGFGIS